MAIAMIDRDSTGKGSRSKTVKDSVQQRFRRIQKAATLLKQMADPTRLRIVQILSRDEWHVGALCEELKMSQPAVSHHLALLRHGGLIVPRRQGKHSYYSLTDAGSELEKIVRSVTV
jgi:DNA-binding transcriptional ArsR family regulator